MEFQGTGLALSEEGIDRATSSAHVSDVELWTVLKVETSGCGFLPDRRPIILFERHIFHRLTGGRFDDGDISSPSPSGYGPGGAHQFERLERAVALDRSAALQSASWGIGQIMGENYVAAGFDNVEDMVTSALRSEDEQVSAMVSFLQHSNLTSALNDHDWQRFARGYNGANFAINQYDSKLATAFTEFSLNGTPDVTVRAAQLYLTYLGFNPGRVDGVAGARTMSALRAFYVTLNIATPSSIDRDVVSALVSAVNSRARGASP